MSARRDYRGSGEGVVVSRGERVQDCIYDQFMVLFMVIRVKEVKAVS